MARMISAYPPEFLKVWTTALAQDVTLTFPSAKEARGFQLQLNLFRRQLTDERHPSAGKFTHLTTRRNENQLIVTSTARILSQAIDQELQSTDPTDEELDKYLEQLNDNTDD